MLDSFKTPLVLVGRILIAFMFMQSGYEKLTDLTGTAGYIASGGLPNSTTLAGLAGAFELVAGLAILIGFKACWAALVLAAFTVVASFLYHRYCIGTLGTQAEAVDMADPEPIVGCCRARIRP